MKSSAVPSKLLTATAPHHNRLSFRLSPPINSPQFSAEYPTQHNNGMYSEYPSSSEARWSSPPLRTEAFLPQVTTTDALTQAHRVVAQIVLVGSRVLGRAFVEAYRQAQASAKYAKAAQAGTVSGNGTTINARGGLTLDEAYKILSVKPNTEAGGLSMESVAVRYKTLFERNDPKKGGSFYLQSKIYRARERLDQEIKQAAEKAKTAEP
jgi:import inner membrane translocase subunit TIM16